MSPRVVQPDSRALFASVTKQLRDMTDRNFLREEGWIVSWGMKFFKPLVVRDVVWLAMARVTIFITSKIKIVIIESTCSLFVFY